MRLIDADNIDFSHSSKELYPLLHYILDLFDAQPTIKAYTKDEVIIMLTELKTEIEGIQGKYSPYYDEASQYISEIIQQKINEHNNIAAKGSLGISMICQRC